MGQRTIKRMVGVVILVMNTTTRTSTLQFHLPIWMAWNRKILVPRMEYLRLVINGILHLKGLRVRKRAHHHQPGGSHFQLRGLLRLIPLINWTHHVMHKRMLIWLALEAHQQDAGPDLLKSVMPTVEELPLVSCLNMHGITLLQMKKHSLDVEMGHHGEDLPPLEEQTGHRDGDLHPLEEEMDHHNEDLHPLKEEMGHHTENLYPLKEDMGHHDEGLLPLKEDMGHQDEGLLPLKEGMGHRGEDLHPLKEEPHPRGGVHQGGGIPHQGGGIPLQEGGIPLQEGDTPHQERETHHQGGGTPLQGRGIGQNPGHLQGKLIHLDREGNMVDLDQGLHTRGITIKVLQEEDIHQGTDHLQQVIVSILLKDLGHHLPTGRLDWVSLGRICLLQVLAMPPLSESWRRNSLSLDV